MFDPSNGITFRTVQEAMPEYPIFTDLVRGELAAMPPPAAIASHAWCRERLARLVDEVSARVPMDAAQGHSGGQLVVVEFLADEMLERITTWELSLAARAEAAALVPLRAAIGATSRLQHVAREARRQSWDSRNDPIHGTAVGAGRQTRDSRNDPIRGVLGGRTGLVRHRAAGGCGGARNADFAQRP